MLSFVFIIEYEKELRLGINSNKTQQNFLVLDLWHINRIANHFDQVLRHHPSDPSGLVVPGILVFLAVLVILVILAVLVYHGDLVILEC